MAEWLPPVSKEEFEDYLESVRIEHGRVHSKVKERGFTVFYVEDEGKDTQWIAKRVSDSSGTHYYITDF